MANNKIGGPRAYSLPASSGATTPKDQNKRASLGSSSSNRKSISTGNPGKKKVRFRDPIAESATSTTTRNSLNESKVRTSVRSQGETPMTEREKNLTVAMDKVLKEMARKNPGFEKSLKDSAAKAHTAIESPRDEDPEVSKPETSAAQRSARAQTPIEEKTGSSGKVKSSLVRAGKAIAKPFKSLYKRTIGAGVKGANRAGARAGLQQTIMGVRNNLEKSTISTKTEEGKALLKLLNDAEVQLQNGELNRVRDVKAKLDEISSALNNASLKPRAGLLMAKLNEEATGSNNKTSLSNERAEEMRNEVDKIQKAISYAPDSGLKPEKRDEYHNQITKLDKEFNKALKDKQTPPK